MNDLVFPLFCLFVGNASSLSMSDWEKVAGDFFKKWAKRTLLIFLIGLALNGFSFFRLQ